MVHFLTTFLFVSSTVAILAQPGQPQILPALPETEGVTEAPPEGPGGFFPGFPRGSGAPLILGPGPVIGGSGFGDQSPFGQRFGGSNGFPDNNGQGFPGNNDIPNFRKPGVIETRNNIPSNGFPSIAGPGPVRNPNTFEAATTPFPPIVAGLRKKRAAAKPVATGPSASPAPIQDAPIGGGLNLPVNNGNFPGSNNGQFPNSNNQFPDNQQGGFGFGGQQTGGFPGSGSFPNNNGFGNGQNGFPNTVGGSTPRPFGGFPNGNNFGQGNQNGFTFGNGFFPNNGQSQFGQNGGFRSQGGFVDQQGFRQTGPFIDQPGLGQPQQPQPIQNQ